MLSGAVIGLQPAEAQRVAARNRFREPHRRLAGRDAAAPAADIDLDEHVEHDIVAGGRLGRLADAVEMIDAEPDLRFPSQFRQPVELGRARDLVADQHVADAAFDQNFRLRDLLAALADGAMGDLAQRDLGALMGLGMGPQPDAVPLRIGGHGDEVALEGVEIEDQGRRVDLGETLAGLGRRVKGHGLSRFPESVAPMGRQVLVRSKTRPAIALVPAP